MPVAPPPNTAVNDLFSTTSTQNQGDQDGDITCGWQVSAVVGLGVSYLQVVNAIDAAWKTQLQTYGSSTVTFEGTTLHVFNPATGFSTQIAESSNASNMGSDTTGLVPRQCRLVLTKKTTVPGRSGRGRFYHPFLCKDQITALGEIASFANLALGIAYNNAFSPTTVASGVNSATVVPGLIARKPLPLTFTALASIVATGLIGTQRRSGDYGRLNPPRPI